MRPIRLSLLPLVAFALSACAWQVPWPTAQTTTEKPAGKIVDRLPSTPVRSKAVASNDSYRLDSGDRVRIVVSGQDALSNSYDVNDNGTIEVPSVGPMQARGLNTVQLSDAIAKRLKNSNVRDPQVAAQVETYRPFTIRGEVANPGQYPYVNNMTTETAIAIAGGLKPGADKSAVTVSSDAQGPARTPSAPGSLVRPGDTVVVSEER